MTVEAQKRVKSGRSCPPIERVTHETVNGHYYSGCTEARVLQIYMRQKKLRKTAGWQASTRLSFSSRSVGARDSQWAGAGCRPWSRHIGLGSRPGGKKMQLIKDQTATVGMGNIQPRKSSIFEWTLPSATLFKPWCLQFKILLLNCLTCLSYLHKEWKATWQTGSTPHNYGAAPGLFEQ